MQNDELYCLLVPLHEERLWVPRAARSEVINYQVPTPMEGAPPWYLGTTRGRPPGASFRPSRLRRTPPRAGGRTRMVVMQAITVASPRVFAIPDQDSPARARERGGAARRLACSANGVRDLPGADDQRVPVDSRLERIETISRRRLGA
jgi:hypothetical protein